MRQIQRYEIPIDDQPHPFELSGSVLSIAAKSGASVVEMWAESGNGVPVSRSFQVFAEGQSIPDNAQWIGTTDRTSNGKVWHLYEVGIRLAVAPPIGAPQ